MAEFDFSMEDEHGKIAFSDALDELSRNWASFTLSVIEPELIYDEVAKIIEPEPLPDTQVTEFVYPIYDHFSTLSTSKALELCVPGMANCKLFYTIEKMIFILIERIKEIEGITEETEVKIAFEGHEQGKRKAFESVINLAYNVVVINFDPGAWGERYLQVVKNLAEKEYGYPSKTPRTIYREFKIPARLPAARR